jgi:hypothetical protein
MSKKSKIAEPRIEDFVRHGGARDGAGRKMTGRKSITLYLKAEIIKHCRPHPATKLRTWIEANYPLGEVKASKAKEA